MIDRPLEKAAKLDYTPIVDIKAVKPQSKNELDPNGMKKRFWKPQNIQ